LIREEIRHQLNEASFDPYVPATIVSDRMGNILLTFEYGNEPVEVYLQRSQEIETLKRDSQPDEPGIVDMDEAIDTARSGYSVDIKVHDSRAHAYWRSQDVYR